jgi:subtilisin family serine protease
MSSVKGKIKLCITSSYTKYFKAIQGIDGKSLFDRYNALNTIVKSNIEVRFKDFLSEPIIDEENIEWFTKTPSGPILNYLNLTPEDKGKYEEIKYKTIQHYENVINNLKSIGKEKDAIYLENAIKFIHEKYLYCYDDMIVLGVWGMDEKEEVRESIGVACKDVFVNKAKVNEPEPEPEKPTPQPEKYSVKFNAGEHGQILNSQDFFKSKGELVSQSEIPSIDSDQGFRFIGWDKDPINNQITEDTTFTALYEKVEIPIPPTPPPVTVIPWWRRLWLFLTERGCLKWLLWLLLLILLLFLILFFFKGCNKESQTSNPIPSPIDEKPWVSEDPRVGQDGGIYDPGNPYTPVPTPPDHTDILPPQQGTLPPLDSSSFVIQPGKPVIVGNRLNILMENEDKSILDLAKKIKDVYPDDKYKIVYYDNVVKRLQLEFPETEREQLKNEIPSKFAPEYTLFVFDESVFENRLTPNDPAMKNADQSWYLNTIKAEEGWEIVKGTESGKKVTVAIIDNGFSLEHPELKSKVVMPYNVWSHSNKITAQKVDHGTHVAGTALAISNNNLGIAGIASQSAFMPVQVANNQGLITTTSILDGILYALYQGADVLNISLGTRIEGQIPIDEQKNLQNNYFKEEERLWNEIMKISNKHKAILVIAAGNDNILAGIEALNRPKNFIVVSAIDKNNNILKKAGFSNYGNFSKVSAPGVYIYSTVSDDKYQFMSGTSMAAPMVAGTIALMKSIKADLTAEQALCVLQSTGIQADNSVGNIIQIDKALLKVKSGDFANCVSTPETPSSGDVQILLNWDNINDLDLVCMDPNGEVVWFKNKSVSSGGKLEIDMNAGATKSNNPLENIYWPTGGAPNGTYRVAISYYKQYASVDATNFKATIKYGDSTKIINGAIKSMDKNKSIFEFTLGNKSRGPTPDQSSNSDDKVNDRQQLEQEKQRLQSQLEKINKKLDEIDKVVK